ncbi:MAG: UxaA family hydrolase [Firmicutes bacterium]|jgi:altronate dehydratase|nr:UxaA family hydrolase [Bacillota bacterium]
MLINAILISDTDTVVTVTRELSPGDEIIFMSKGKRAIVKARSSIPIYHKAAIKQINQGEAVLKYGEIIGHATTAILPGEHVHTHNLAT